MSETNTVRYRHTCESCGMVADLSAEDGFNAGWDFPPRMGVFGVLSPRTCPNCVINKTLWWRLTMGEVTQETLTADDVEFLKKVAGEPESILIPSE